MKIIEFTMDDARKCADLLALLTSTNKLIDSLKLAGIQIQGPAAANKENVLSWVKELATHMATEIVAKEKAAKEKQQTILPSKVEKKTKVPATKPKKK